MGRRGFVVSPGRTGTKTISTVFREATNGCSYWEYCSKAVSNIGIYELRHPDDTDYTREVLITHYCTELDRKDVTVDANLYLWPIANYLLDIYGDDARLAWIMRNPEDWADSIVRYGDQFMADWWTVALLQVIQPRSLNQEILSSWRGGYIPSVHAGMDEEFKQYTRARRLGWLWAEIVKKMLPLAAKYPDQVKYFNFDELFASDRLEPLCEFFGMDGKAVIPHENQSRNEQGLTEADREAVRIMTISAQYELRSVKG